MLQNQLLFVLMQPLESLYQIFVLASPRLTFTYMHNKCSSVCPLQPQGSLFGDGIEQKSSLIFSPSWAKSSRELRKNLPVIFCSLLILSGSFFPLISWLMKGLSKLLKEMVGLH